MKLSANKIFIISIISVIIMILVFSLFQFSKWYSSFMPSSGIWQYNDGDLEITVYMPSVDKGISINPVFAGYKAEFSYKGEKQKAMFAMNIFHYWCHLQLLNDYDEIKEDSEKFISRKDFAHNDDAIINSSYLVPLEKDEWVWGNIQISDEHKDLLGDYEGKNLVFKKIGKYKEPE